MPGVSGLVGPSDFAGGNYPSGTVTFAPGVTSQVVTIPILGDAPFEANEGFVVSISSDSYNAVIATRSANGIILNDNIPPDYVGTAGNDTISFANATSGKTYNAHIYIDTNDDESLGPGDMLIQVSGVGKGSVGASSFAF